MDTDRSAYEPWESFLAKGLYREPVQQPVIKHARAMGKTLICDLHPNAEEQGALAGKGKAYVRWALCQQDWLKENHCESPFSLLVDATLEPHAGFGVHGHHQEEELIYVLEGAMEATVIARDGTRRMEVMGQGALLIIRLGEQHGGVAGPEGCRYLAIVNRHAPEPPKS